MEPKPAKAVRYRVPALEKGLDILEKLASSSRPVSLTQLSQQLGRTNNEIYRMLTCLEQRGYIFKDDATGNYALSLRLYELALTHSPVDRLLAAAQLPMEDLALKVGESCHLSVIDGSDLLVLWQALSPGKVRITVQVGGRFSPISTVSGRILLANLPADKCAACLKASGEFQKMSSTERQDIRAQLDDIRLKGTSYAESETIFGVKDYAVLVGNPRVGLVAALAISSLTSVRSAIAKKEIFTALQECATLITHNAGC